MVKERYGVREMQEKNLSGARRRLREQAEEMRYSLRELSLLIERNATYLTQYVNKGSPRDLTERDRQRLAFLLKVTAQDLSDTPDDSAPAARPEPQRFTGPELTGLGGVPVLSVALVGDLMGRIPADQAVESVERPRSLEGVRNGFAVRVSSNAFYPAFRPGDVAFIHPNIPPLAGDLVCVTGRDGRLLLGRLTADSSPDQPTMLSFAEFRSVIFDGASVEKVVAVHYR